MAPTLGFKRALVHHCQAYARLSSATTVVNFITSTTVCFKISEDAIQLGVNHWQLQLKYSTQVRAFCSPSQLCTHSTFRDIMLHAQSFAPCRNCRRSPSNWLVRSETSAQDACTVLLTGWRQPRHGGTPGQDQGTALAHIPLSAAFVSWHWPCKTAPHAIPHCGQIGSGCSLHVELVEWLSNA